MSNEAFEPWEYPTGSGIRIREKINTAGKQAFGISFEVTVPARVTGNKRARKQFKTKEDAELYADNQFKGFRKQGESYFNATTAERNEFANLVPKLRKAGISLTEAVEFALPRLRPAGGNRTLVEIIKELRDSKAAMLKRGTLREHSERAFRMRTRKIEDEFPRTLARDLTLDQVKAWLVSMDAAPRTVKNHLNCLSEVLRFAVARQYVAENVLDRLTAGDRRELCGQDTETEPAILTPKEAERLLEAAAKHNDLELLAPVALALFCGLRTEELKRLDWKDVRIDEGFVTIGSAIAKKRRIRNVTIPENAKAWLSLVHRPDGPITRSAFFSDYSTRFRRLVIHAGFYEMVTDEKGEQQKRAVWKKNAMRHSFGSYHFALHADSMRTATELGHRQSDTVLFDHYRALASKEQAKAFFNITPAKQARKVVSFAS